MSHCTSCGAPTYWEAELEQAKAENARLREALEWYANTNNYRKALVGSPALIDGGEKARRALEVKA